MDGKQTEEDYLRETLAALQESYNKAAKPYLERLVAIHNSRPPQRMIVTTEQAEALGIKVPNKIWTVAPTGNDAA